MLTNRFTIVYVLAECLMSITGRMPCLNDVNLINLQCSQRPSHVSDV